jgi:hypothetical protein
VDVDLGRLDSGSDSGSGSGSGSELTKNKPRGTG